MALSLTLVQVCSLPCFGWRGVMRFSLKQGHGHTIDYLDRHRVTKYVAVEPNVLMHGKIRETAASAGYDEAKGTLLILSYGIEELDKITEALGGDHQVDTLVSVLTLCSIPDPQAVIPAVVKRLIKPNGGQLLFHEHVQSPREDVQWWQAVWSPIWSIAFDGCKLGRPTHLWIEAAGGWNIGESSIWGMEGETEVGLFVHRTGRMVRA